MWICSSKTSKPLFFFFFSFKIHLVTSVSPSPSHFLTLCSWQIGSALNLFSLLPTNHSIPFQLLHFFFIRSEKIHVGFSLCRGCLGKGFLQPDRAWFIPNNVSQTLFKFYGLLFSVDLLQDLSLKGIWELKLMTNSHKILRNIWRPSLKSLGRLFQS